MAKAVLGISLGTRRLGIAIVQDERLVHFQMQTFPGTWSDKKLRCILSAIAVHAERQAIGSISVKIPDAMPTSKAFSQLIGSLNILAEDMRVNSQYYTLSDLKLAYSGVDRTSREWLIESIVKRHPELLPEYHKERRNKEAYYYKMFEAVLCAHMSIVR